jgi:S-DNA-T family DNA segregation ATPase FtsK/SpoIIIE
MEINQDINHFIEKELKNIIATLSDTTLFERIKAEEISINKTIEQYRKHSELEFKQEQNKIMQRFSAKSSQVKALIENLGNEKNFNVSKEYAAQIEDALKELISKIEYEQDNEIKILKERLNIKVEKIIEAYKEKIKDLPQKRIDEVTKIIDSKSSQLKVLDDYYETASFESKIWNSDNLKLRNNFPLINYLSLNDIQNDYYLFDNSFTVKVPDVLSFIFKKSITIKYKNEQKIHIQSIIDQIVLRLLMSAEPGNILFYFIDGFGNGNSFLDYLDLPKAIYNNKIFTSPDELSKVLNDLIYLAENIIPSTIKTEKLQEYNSRNRNAIIPYRFVIIDKFPQSISINNMFILEKLIRIGIHAGIHFILITNESDYNEKTKSVIDKTLVYSINRNFVFIDKNKFERIKKNVYDFTDKTFNTERNIHFEQFYNESFKWWQKTSASGLTIPLGIKGSSDFNLEYKGENAHAVLAGSTGCGKSYLLHTIIHSACLNYSPNELKLFLIDLKAGVEFKRYATHQLPHAEFIALHASPEFGLHILRVLRQRIEERASLFKEKGVADLNKYKSKYPDDIMPRYLIVIDEYQEIFTKEFRSIAWDEIAKIAKQGRSYGFNLLLASQTVELATDTLGQFGLRIAMRLPVQVSRLLLNSIDDRTPQLKKGQAIVNDTENDEIARVQSFYLKDDVNEELLKKSNENWLAETNGKFEHNLIVFDRESKAYLENNKTLQKSNTVADSKQLLFSPGEKLMVDGKDLICRLNREPNNNIIATGGKLDVSLKAISGVLMSIIRQLDKKNSEVLIFNYVNKSNTELYNTINESKDYIKSLVNKTEFFEQDQSVAELLDKISADIENRYGSINTEKYFPSKLIVFYNIENNADFHEIPTSSRPKTKKSEQMEKLFQIMEKGPVVGIHCLIHTASPDNYFSMFDSDNNDINVFNHRILLQMSEDDSRHFLGKYTMTDASKLTDIDAGESGFNRAIYYDNYTQSFFEVIKPYEFFKPIN